MDVKIIEISPLSTRFILSGVSPAFANAIRRTMMAEVPKMAIDEISVYENDSLLYDEQLALRFGLLPIKTDLSSYILKSKCKCRDGCPSCQVSMTLSVEGPKIVYSGDLVSKDPKIKPVDPKIPIVKLRENERLYLEAVARLGTGKEHVKWSPTIACSYKNYPRIDISEKCDACGECIKICPRNVLEVKEKVSVKDEKECSFCKLCEEACKLDAISVQMDEKTFIFSFESDGSLSPEEIILQAIDVIKDKVKEFKKKIG